jgi:hypothetical protein
MSQARIELKVKAYLAYLNYFQKNCMLGSIAARSHSKC